MRIDWFMADVGLAQAEELDAVALGLLAEEAEGFLRAGGTVPWPEWIRLGPDSREAFRAAGDRIARERAATIALALLSPTVAEGLLAGKEIEDAAVSAALTALADRIAGEVGSGE